MKTVLQFAIITLITASIAGAQAAPRPVPPAPPAKPAAPAKPAKARSYLGVDIRNVTHERMAELKVPEARGAEVTLVDGDSPAGKAGLEEHDVILSFNGHNIQNTQELRRLIRQTPPGKTVELGISRGGQAMTLKAQLADRGEIMADMPNIHVHIPKIEVPVVAVYPRRNGLMVENLTPQLGEAFGVKGGAGVLVRSVEPESPAAKAGLRAGDVIVRVGQEPVADTSDWSRLMRRQKPGTVPVGIVRERRPQTVTLAVPEQSEQSFAFSGMEDFDLEPYKNEMLQLRRLQPEIERAMRDAQERIQHDLQRHKQEWQREAERARRQAQRELERAQRDQERAWREQQREQREMQHEPEKPAPPTAPETPKPPQ